MRAPTAFMTPIWRVCWAMIAFTVFTTRKPEASEGEEAQEAEDQEDAGEQVVGGVLAGRRDEGEEDRHPGPLQPLAHRLGDAADLVAGQRRVVDEDPQLVVGRAVAEVGERLEGDVPVEATDVEGGRRPDLVGEPGDPEPVDRSVDGLDLDVAGGRDVGQGEARALQEEVAARRRPGRALPRA